MEPFELLPYLVQTLERLRLPYLITGSTATSLYGEPRFTNDIDVIVDLREQQVAAFCAAFPDPEYYLSEVAVREAIKQHRQFNIIHPTSGLKVDVIIPKDTPFDRSRLSRGIRLAAGPGYNASFASPEDVIVKKLDFFRQGGSDKHLRDIAGVMKIRRDELDLSYINHWATELGLLDVWAAVLKRVNGGAVNASGE
ncbi:MAG: hypothetical protein WD648_00030 [Planctomycetaceae bacterium]